MPRVSICSTIWILTLLLVDLIAMGNKKYPNECHRYHHLQERTLPLDFSKRSFWKRSLLGEDNSIELSSLNETSRFEHSEMAEDANVFPSRPRDHAMDTVNERTLMDYDGPAIVEDFNDKDDQDFAKHIRVKRSEPTTNDSVIRRKQDQPTNNLDNSISHFWDESNAIYTYDESTSEFEGSHVDLNRKNGSDGVHLRRKRGILSKNRQRKKRVKGNAKLAKYRVKTKIKSKRRSTSKPFRNKPATKKTNGSGKRGKKTATAAPVEAIDASRMGSRIEKRESENGNLNADIPAPDSTHEKRGASIDRRKYVSLINDGSPDEARGGSAIVLPFVHTGKAEVRVRIEKIPTNESSFTDTGSRTDCFPTATPFPTTLPRYTMIDRIIDNVTSSEPTANSDSAVRNATCNSTLEITLKALDCAGDIFNRGTSDLEGASFRPIESASPRTIADARNSKGGERDSTNEMLSAASADEDAKLREKRNQEDASRRRYLRSGANATGSRRFKHAESARRTPIAGAERERSRRGRTTRGSRAARSIEEIKELAEKLIAKVNELQAYASNRNETLRTADPCVDGSADCTGLLVEAPSSPAVLAINSRERENPKSLVTGDSDKRRHSTRRSGEEQRAVSVRRRASRMPSGASKFTREHRSKRKSRRKWARWTDWSSCSVTCGKGRQIRWRHCLRDCDDAETEMEEKACQLPACPPGKFLGIF